MVRTYITYLFLLFCDYKYISVQKDWKQIVLGETQRVRTDDKCYRGNYSVLLTVQKWEIISLCSQKITYIYIWTVIFRSYWTSHHEGVSEPETEKRDRERKNKRQLASAGVIHLSTTQCPPHARRALPLGVNGFVSGWMTRIGTESITATWHGHL